MILSDTLIKRLKAGDESAFREVVEAHQDQVLNTCFHYLHHPLDAEDLAQEVFIEVHRSIHQFKGDSRLSTWIYRIAVNKSLDWIRKKNRKKRFAHLVSLFGNDDQEREIQLPAPGNPESLLEDKERIKILHVAIDQLADKQKTALTLSKFQGLSNKEIAEIMSVSVSSVESLLHRSKKGLKQKLQKYFYDFY